MKWSELGFEYISELGFKWPRMKCQNNNTKEKMSFIFLGSAYHALF